MAYTLPTFKIAKDGQDLNNIAKANGIDSGKTIWLHKKNQKLAKLRGEPRALKKGDVIVLPMPKAYKTTLSDMIVQYAKALMQQTAFRKNLLAEVANAEKNLKELGKFRVAILKLNDSEIAKVDKAANLALEKRAQADFIQNVLTMHKAAVKAGAIGVAKTGKLGQTLAKSADNTNQISKAAQYLMKSKYFRDMAPGFKPGLDIILDIKRGSASFAVDIGADASSADTSLGKALKFVDDATSITHYLWMGTRAAMTGKVSWDSIQDDKKKSIKRLWGKVRDALGAVVDTENRNKQLIKDHKAQIKVLDKDLAAMEKHLLHLLALDKL